MGPQGIPVADPGAGDRRRGRDGAGKLRRGHLSRSGGRGRQGRQAEHRLRRRLHHHGADRHGLRAAPRARRPARRGVHLYGQRPRRGLRRGLSHPLPVLGGHGLRLGLPGLRPRRRAGDRGRVPLPDGPCDRRLGAARRHRALRPRHGLTAVRPSGRCAGPRRLADPRGLHAQRRGAAAQRLADRRLPGGNRHRGSVHERLHHQDRGLRAGPRLPGDRAAGLVRHGDGDLRRDLRGAGERLPAAARLSHRQPGGLHGGRHRHRHRAGAERRDQPRLRAHPLQGAPVHGRRGGDLRHRAAQADRARRALRGDAADRGALHGRGLRDLGLPVLLGLRDEVDGGRRRRPGPPRRW